MKGKKSQRKGKSVRNFVISILVSEWPLSLRNIYDKIEKDYEVDVTYQAVFKMIKGLVNDGVLKKKGRTYLINLDWVNRIHDLTESVLANYSSGESIEKIKELLSRDTFKSDPRVLFFLKKLGSTIENYFRDEPGCIMAIRGSGTFLGLGIKNYLSGRGKNITYFEIIRDYPKFRRKEMKNRKLLIVDSGIDTGITFRAIMKKVALLKKRFKITDVKYAVVCDLMGLADWSATKKPYIPFDFAFDHSLVTIFG